MNPIEEMMEKFGVEKQLDVCQGCLKEENCEYCNKKSLGVYALPDFTPEKQLEIIKLISQRTPFYLDIKERNKHTLFTINTDFGSASHFSFDKALAEFLLKIFYYCSTEALIQQIKEILEG